MSNSDHTVCLNVPVYKKCSNVYKLEYCVELKNSSFFVGSNHTVHSIYSKLNFDKKRVICVIIVKAEKTTIGFTNGEVYTYEYEKFSFPKSKTFQCDLYDKTIVSNRTGIVVLSDCKLETICSFFDHHVSFHNQIPGCHIESYLSNIISFQKGVLDRLVSNVQCIGQSSSGIQKLTSKKRFLNVT